jgi:hypothetical protein
MLRQPAFADADFHTGYLDELLQQRRGTPFSAPDVSLEEVAVAAAAIYAAARRAAVPSPVVPSPVAPSPVAATGPVAGGGWARQARVEGVRD